MLVLWILLGILIFILAVGSLPVSVTAEYQSSGAAVVARLGPFKIPLYPGKDTEKTEKPQEKEQETKEQPASEETRPKGGGLGQFRELLDLVLKAQADVRNKLRIRELILYLTVGGKGDNPAAAGILTGSAWAALGGLVPLLESGFRIENRDFQVNTDFLSEETLVYAKATAGMSLGAGLRLALNYGVQGLKWYRKQKQKGGKEHGTSNR